MDVRALIMAGGSGTRFWPLSRKQRPKQFLPIISEKSMIEETTERLRPHFAWDHIYTIANPEHTQSLQHYLPEVPENNFLVEPDSKNTAPCLILATAMIYLDNPEAVVAVLPADHLIQDRELFIKKLLAGAQAASSSDSLITFGIPPFFPATGYGYIQFAEHGGLDADGESFLPVLEFKEKPDEKSAQAFLEAGNYFWNSGMFLWQAQVFAQKLQKFAPSLYVFWENILDALPSKDTGMISSLYQEMPSISIDYALMEKAQGVLMGEGSFGWSDVGAWSALAEFWPQDKNNNAIRGKSITIETKNCLVYNPKKLTTLIGIKDIVVVETEDALLICRKDMDQKVKDVVAQLKQGKQDEYL